MFLCFVGNGSGGWVTSEVSSVADCSGFVAQSAVGFVDSTALNSLFDLYFKFDASLFSFITGSNLLVFISGHVIGRIVRGLSKV